MRSHVKIEPSLFEPYFTTLLRFVVLQNEHLTNPRPSLFKGIKSSKNVNVMINEYQWAQVDGSPLSYVTLLRHHSQSKPTLEMQLRSPW